MAVRTDAANRLVIVDAILDLATAVSVRDAVLQMKGDVCVDLRGVRDLDDSALVFLVTGLRLAGCRFTIRGLSWPHADVLEYLGVRQGGDRGSS